MLKMPRIVTAGGWARSGKGTSMEHLRSSLEKLGRSVELIDQGIKFRAMGAVATAAGEPLDSPTTLDAFIRQPKTQAATIALLDEVAAMNRADRDAVLYTPEMSKASGQVGSVASSHEVAIGLLKTQVEAAAEAETNVVIIDGRSIEKYARQFEEEGLAKFVIGWYFRCDPAIAARRSRGLFGPIDEMSLEDRLSLLKETFNISDRNRSDMLRSVDPLRDPVRAYRLDFFEYASPDRIYTPYKISQDIIYQTKEQVAMVDTSYTNCIEDMTGPITELSSYALMFAGALSQADVGMGTIEYAGSGEA